VASTAIGILLGLLVGLRHSFEPDHLTAVSTLVGETRDLRGGAMLGALWGVGHTLALVAVGAILLLVGASLPERAAVIFELCVAGMLLVLGARAIAVALRAAAAAQHAHLGPHLGPHGRAPLWCERSCGDRSLWVFCTASPAAARSPRSRSPSSRVPGRGSST
jgi:hypothetical protein